jgi:hypothetical protein
VLHWPDLFLSGKGLGQRIVELVGEGEVVGFIATPGQLNIQPRLDGAKEAMLPVMINSISRSKGAIPDLSKALKA